VESVDAFIRLLARLSDLTQAEVPNLDETVGE